MSEARVDLQQLRREIRRLARRAPRDVANGLARVVDEVPDERLEQILRTPIRRAVLEAIFWQMPQYFNRKLAAGTDATIRWEITGRADGGADVFDLVIKEGRCRVDHGPGGEAPKVTITLDAVEFVKLATNNSDPMQAYFKGRVRLAGDIMVAAKIRSLFKIPGGRPKRPQPSSTVSSSR